MKKVARVCVLVLIMVGFAGCGKKEATPAAKTDLPAVTKIADTAKKDTTATADEAKKTTEDTKLPETPKDHPSH